MSLDGLPPAHLRVLLDGLPVFERYGLLLAGGYAFRAHEILHRPSQDLDFATRDDTRCRRSPRMSSLRSSAQGIACGLSKRPASGMHVWYCSFPVPMRKARAWHDRFVIRDIIDLHAVAGTFSYADLENLARRHDPDLDLEAIRDHLAGVSVFADEDFTEYGLDEATIADLRNWVTGWYDDLALRLVADLTDDEVPDDP